MQLDVLPQTRIPITNTWNPIPTLGSDERRSIDSEVTAIFPRAGGDGLLVWNAGMRRWRDMNSQYVRRAAAEHIGDVKDAACERALDVAQALAIQPDFRGVVDPIERQCEPLTRDISRQIEAAAIPVILPTQAFWNGHVVQAVGRIRVDPSRDQRGENRARNDRCIPTTVVKPRRGELRRCSCHPRSRGQLPCPE